MPKKEEKQFTQSGLERLLGQQTVVILDAVDERINKSESRFDKKIDKLELQIDKKFELVNRKIEASELRINKKIDHLIITLDRFLKRMTDMEDEFKMMKNDINRMKKIISEKLGVDIL